MYPWGVVLAYCFAVFTANLPGFGFAAISTTLATFFDVSFNAMNFVTMLTLCLPFLSLFLAMWFADSAVHIELPFYIPMILLCAFRWIAVLQASNGGVLGYKVYIVTQGLSALVMSFLNVLPPVLSAKYFSKEQRYISQALGTMASPIGTGAGMVLAPAFKDNIPLLFKLYAGSLTMALIVSFFFFDLRNLFCNCFHKKRNAPETGICNERFSSTCPMQAALRPDSLPGNMVEQSLLKKAELSSLSFYFLHTEADFVEEQRNHETVALSNSDGNFEQERVEEELASLLINRPIDDEMKVESFWGVVKFICSNAAFVRLTISVSLFMGVAISWLTLIDQVAPPSVNSPFGKQLIVGLLFGFGIVSVVLTNAAVVRYRNYWFVGRAICLISVPCTALAMVGWSQNVAWMVYVGMALQGLVCFGLLPLCIEYGIEIITITQDTSKSNSDRNIELDDEVRKRNVNATIGGIITNAMNIVGCVTTYITTPGNVERLTQKTIPLVWMGIMLFGAITFFTLPKTLS